MTNFFMKKLTILLFSILISFNSYGEDDMYDFGHKLATCSGDFEQLSDMFSILQHSAEAKVLKEKSNGWMIGAVVSFMYDEMKPKVAWSSAQGVHDTTITNWQLRLGTNDSKQFIKKFNSSIDKQFNESFNELMGRVKECVFYDEFVESAIKIYRQSI